jgi:hypothetical protein
MVKAVRAQKILKDLFDRPGRVLEVFTAQILSRHLGKVHCYPEENCHSEIGGNDGAIW